MAGERAERPVSSVDDALAAMRELAQVRGLDVNVPGTDETTPGEPAATRLSVSTRSGRATTRSARSGRDGADGRG